MESEKTAPCSLQGAAFIGCIIFGVDEEIHSHLFFYKKIETNEFSS